MRAYRTIGFIILLALLCGFITPCGDNFDETIHNQSNNNLNLDDDTDVQQEALILQRVESPMNDQDLGQQIEGEEIDEEENLETNDVSTETQTMKETTNQSSVKTSNETSKSTQSETKSQTNQATTQNNSQTTNATPVTTPTPSVPETTSPPVQEIVTTSTMTAQEQALFDSINQERTSLGRSPLKFDQDLYKACLTRALESSTCYSHTRPNGTLFNTVSPKADSEALLKINSESGTKAFSFFMSSDSHKTILLSSKYNSSAVASMRIDGFNYWVVLLYEG